MVYCHQHPISPPRVFVFHKKPLCLWKTVQILFRQYRIILSTDTASEMRQPFIRSSFLFFMIESIGGPYYRPQLEELLCTKPNSRATPKRRPALYMP